MALKAPHCTLSPALICRAMKRCYRKPCVLPIFILLVMVFVCVLPSHTYACAHFPPPPSPPPRTGVPTYCQGWQDCLTTFIDDSIQDRRESFIIYFWILISSVLLITNKWTWKGALLLLLTIYLATFVDVSVLDRLGPFVAGLWILMSSVLLVINKWTWERALLLLLAISLVSDAKQLFEATLCA
jgi:hypothetical protein